MLQTLMTLQLEKGQEYKVGGRPMIYHRLAHFHDKRNNRHRHLPIFKCSSMYYLADATTRFHENGAVEVQFVIIQCDFSAESCARPHEGVRELVDLV